MRILEKRVFLIRAARVCVCFIYFAHCGIAISLSLIERGALSQCGAVIFHAAGGARAAAGVENWIWADFFIVLIRFAASSWVARTHRFKCRYFKDVGAFERSHAFRRLESGNNRVEISIIIVIKIDSEIQFR